MSSVWPLKRSSLFQHLLQRIQQSRVSGAFGIGASAVQTTRSLLAVYLELRENPLVIV